MHQKRYSTILFDWDGCLAQTLKVWLIAYKDTFSRYHINLDDKTIATQVFGNWQGPRNFGVNDNEGFTQHLLSQVDSKMKSVNLNKGVFELLEGLHHQHKQLALLTSSLKEMILPVLNKHHIRDYFNLILDGNDVKNHKPHPDVILKAMNEFHVHQEEVIMIGDSESDLGAANAARVDSMLYYPPSHEIFYDKKVLMTSKPTYIVETFLEAVNILL